MSYNRNVQYFIPERNANMKKLFALLLCLVLCLSVFAACDNQGGTAEDTTAGNDTTAAPNGEDTTAEAKNGCKSTLGGMAILMVAGAVVVAMKKKKE